MDSTPNSSSNRDNQKTSKELIDEVVLESSTSRHLLNEQEYHLSVQDSLQIRGLPANKDNVERIDALVENVLNPKVDSHYKRGDIWIDDPDVNWIWDGWIAEGYFHALIAMQKVGKSTFVLALIAELIKRTPSYLNFPILKGKKEWRFVLIGPDMNRRLWGKYGKLAGLLHEDARGQLKWQEQIEHVFAEEDGIGVDKESIKRMVSIADEIKAQDCHPIFVLDSYRALLATSDILIEENSSQYSGPLRKLKQALGQTGATVILLHHSSQTSSKRSAAESNAGNAAFSSVPDQLISLKWLADPGPDGNRKDKRTVLSASGRTGRVVPDQLLEQSPDWGWSSYGETGDALLHQQALAERDRLASDDATLYDLLNTRTGNGLGATSVDLQEMRDTQSGGRGSWSLTKINRVLRKLERKGLAVVDGQQKAKGDLGGRPMAVWWTFERNNPVIPVVSHSQREGGLIRTEKLPPEEPSPKQIVPCHPVDSKVMYDGKVWTVAEVNLATGMHVITRGAGLQKSDLRLMDLDLFHDDDEEL